jgi:predicted dehydrogenase
MPRRVKPQQTSRRDFLKTTSAISAAVFVGGKVAFCDDRSANSRVRYACIGIDGKGGSDSGDAAGLGDIIGICDIDTLKLDKAATRPGFENAGKYQDFRVMLEELGDSIDAVTVSTPDHMHAPAAAMAMTMGKACFCQKPLTHTVWEARRLQELAKEHNVATQMGNQGTATDGLRRAAALLKMGIIGSPKEVHVTTDRPIWAQGGPRPTPTDAPPFIDWNLWLGLAPERPYAEGYHPFAWRGWWDFGTGALGDMACHTFNMPFAGLRLANPSSIQAVTSGHNGDSYPQKSKIAFEFPANDQRGPVNVFWYDGTNVPDLSIFKGNRRTNSNGDPIISSSVIVGETGSLYSWDDYGENWIVYDNDGNVMPNEDLPEVEFDRSPGHFVEWHQSITGERERSMSNFEDYAGPLTETILLGNLAVWAAAEGEGKKIEWDAETLTPTNAPEVAHIVKKEYRGNYGEFLGA